MSRKLRRARTFAAWAFVALVLTAALVVAGARGVDGLLQALAALS